MNPPPKTPTEIARETVRQLTTRKLAPTPDNYQRIYHEIAGTRVIRPFPTEQMLSLARALPTHTPNQRRMQVQVEKAVSQCNWTGVEKALVDYASLPPPPGKTGAGAPSAESANPGAAAWDEVSEQVARLVDYLMPAMGQADSRLKDLSEQVLATARLRPASPEPLRAALSTFAYRLSYVAEEDGAIKNTLLGLLHLLFENISELSIDDRWLQGQIDTLRDATQPPLSLRRLEEVQVRLRDVIHKQAEAKAQTVAAQEEMKRVLAAFIDRLSTMTESNTSFGSKIDRCARRLEEATTLTDIAPVLQEAIAATRAIALDTARAGEELQQMREKAQQAEGEIVHLQRQLELASAQVRHDPLTGALNRKGLDEDLKRELARARRNGKPLCVAMLDLDNFKKINDDHGHDTGDAALVHLALVARQVLRPQDTVARFGGEEFVIVLPDTGMDQGVEAMTRLQRELTTRFFLKDNERLLITFSAGVAQVSAGEAGAEAIKRADQAMYLAKRSGKNRVVAA